MSGRGRRRLRFTSLSSENVSDYERVARALLAFNPPSPTNSPIVQNSSSAANRPTELILSSAAYSVQNPSPLETMPNTPPILEQVASELVDNVLSQSVLYMQGLVEEGESVMPDHPPSYDSLYGPPPFRFYPEHMQCNMNLNKELVQLSDKLIEQQSALLAAYQQDRLSVIRKYYPAPNQFILDD